MPESTFRARQHKGREGHKGGNGHKGKMPVLVLRRPRLPCRLTSSRSYTKKITSCSARASKETTRRSQPNAATCRKSRNRHQTRIRQGRPFVSSVSLVSFVSFVFTARSCSTDARQSP